LEFNEGDIGLAGGIQAGASKSSPQGIVWLVVAGIFWGDESLEWLINDG